MTTSKYHFPRRAVQVATLLVLTLIPALGIFRIDLSSASFYVLGHQIWWSNFFFISGLAIVIAITPIITYMTIGAAWCGWACPQNLLSEWANNLTYKFLGKRADVRVDGKGMVVAAAKNKAVNWLILGIIFLAAAMVWHSYRCCCTTRAETCGVSLLSAPAGKSPTPSNIRIISWCS
jgi:polyferredoxin